METSKSDLRARIIGNNDLSRQNIWRRSHDCNDDNDQFYLRTFLRKSSSCVLHIFRIICIFMLWKTGSYCLEPNCKRFDFNQIDVRVTLNQTQTNIHRTHLIKCRKI